eukprot:6357001-Karenia_brevis.AAC.1
MASSAVQTLSSAADTDRSGDLDYRKFVAWICGGSDIAKEVSSHFEMLALQNREGHSAVFIHPRKVGWPLDESEAAWTRYNGNACRLRL